MATGTAPLWRLSTTMHSNPSRSYPTLLPGRDRQRKLRGGRTGSLWPTSAADHGSWPLTSRYALIEYRVDDDATTFRDVPTDHHHRGPREVPPRTSSPRLPPTMGTGTTFREIETYLPRSAKVIRSKTPELVHTGNMGPVCHPLCDPRLQCPKLPTRSKWDPIDYLSPRTLHILRRRITDPCGIFPPEPNTNYMSETSRKLSSG